MGDRRDFSEVQDPRELGQRLRELESTLWQLQRAFGEANARVATLPDGDFEVLCVRVGGAPFGIPIGRIREIVRYVQLTAITDAPAVVVGAINLRGSVLPVIDGRRRFGFEAAPPRHGTAIVIVASEQRSAGIVVDRALDVVTVARSRVADASDPGSAPCIAGVVAVGDEVLQLVDVDRLLTRGEWFALSSIDSEDAEGT